MRQPRYLHTPQKTLSIPSHVPICAGRGATHIVDAARDDEQEIEPRVLGFAIPLILVAQILIYPGIDQNGFKSGEPCRAGVSGLGSTAKVSDGPTEHETSYGEAGRVSAGRIPRFDECMNESVRVFECQVVDTLSTHQKTMLEAIWKILLVVDTVVGSMVRAASSFSQSCVQC